MGKVMKVAWMLGIVTQAHDRTAQDMGKTGASHDRTDVRLGKVRVCMDRTGVGGRRYDPVGV